MSYVCGNALIGETRCRNPQCCVPENPAVIRLMQQNVELLLEINALRGIITKMEDHYMSAEAQKFPREVYE